MNDRTETPNQAGHRDEDRSRGLDLGRPKRKTRYFTVGAVLLATAILVVDLSLPLGVAGGVPYVFVVLLGWWMDRSRAIIYLALLSSVLTIVGYFYSPAGGIVWMVLTNRFLALFAIWITAALLTRAKGAEEALNAARDDLESTVVALNTSQHIAHLGSYERNLLTNKLTWHDEMFRLVGLEPHAFEPTTDKFMDFVHPDDRDRLSTVMQAAHNHGQPYDIQYRIRHSDGGQILVRNLLEVDRDHNGAPVLLRGVLYDITSLTRAEEKLRESEERLLGILNMAPEAIIVADENTRISMFSRGAEVMFGYAAEEIIGQPLDTLLPKSRREDHGRYIEKFSRSPESSRTMGQRGEVFGLAKDGREFPAEASVFKVDVAGQRVYTAMVHDITERKHAEEEILLLNKTLEERVSLRTQELAAANIQLTDAMIELKNTQSHPVQTEKLRALGTLIAGVAHELNNPMMGIQNYVDYASRHAHHEKSKAALGKANREIERVTSIVGNMLSFARPAAASFSQIDIQELVDNALHLAEMDLVVKGISIGTDIPTSLPSAWASADGLQQTLLNLILNARDAMAESEVKHMEIKARHENGLVMVDVEDSGSGIKEAIMEAIFDPFFSTKAPGSGTGMGLAVSRQIIEAFGGTLTCENRPGGGATFSIAIPTQRRAQ